MCVSLVGDQLHDAQHPAALHPPRRSDGPGGQEWQVGLTCLQGITFKISFQIYCVLLQSFWCHLNTFVNIEQLITQSSCDGCWSSHDSNSMKIVGRLYQVSWLIAGHLSLILFTVISLLTF